MDPERARPPARPRLGRPDGRAGLGRAALALADARRHALRPARGARRHPVAVPRRGRTPARRSCTSGSGPSRSRGRRRRSRVVEHRPPFESLDAEYPLRLTTGRRLESYNTGAQTTATARRCTAASRSTSRPEDADRLLRRGGRDRARLVAPRRRRGAGAHRPRRCGPGLCFMTFHFPDQVDSNVLTIDATDPKCGTAEFKAAAVRVDKITPRAGRADERRGRAARRDHGRLMDIHSDRSRADQRRARGRRPPARPAGERLGRRRAPARARRPHGASAATPRAAAGTSCCRRCGRCRSTSAGSARARSTTSASGSRCRRPTPTAWRPSTPCSRPIRARRASIHVCEDLACRCLGSDELIAQLEERLGPEGDLSDDGSATWYRSPCLGQCDRAPAALVTSPASSRASTCWRPPRPRRARARWRASVAGDPVTALPQPGRPALRLLAPRRPRRPGQPRRLPGRRRLRGAAAGDRARARRA